MASIAHRVGASRRLTLLAAGALAIVGALVLGVATLSGAHSDERGGGHETEEEGWVAPASIYGIATSGGAPERLTQVGPGFNAWNDAQPNAPTFPGAPADGRILFSSARPASSDGTTDSEIYVMGPDGSDVEQLTDNGTATGESGEPVPINDDNPAWSPDGEWIAFDSAPEAGSENLADTQIWVMKADGSDPLMITRSPPKQGPDGLGGPSFEPAWSFDGTEIAFSRGNGRNAHVVKIGFDAATGMAAGPEALLTNPGLHTGHPAFSSDGAWLAFQRGAGANADVYLKRLADGALFQLAVETDVAEASPAFNPSLASSDPQMEIAYQRGDEAFGAEIWILKFDPMNPADVSFVQLTDPSTYADRNPTWSATGDRVIYESSLDNPPAADLAVEKTATPDTVFVGSNVTFTITVTNTGPMDAPGVTLKDTLPAGLQHVSAEASQGTVSESGGVITALLGDLARSESGAPVSATVTVVARAATPGAAANTASVSSSILDPISENDSVELLLSVLAIPVQPVVPSPPPAPSPPECTIIGTPRNDVLTGTRGPDVICGLGGADWINARGGDDIVRGGPGADRIAGGPGHDLLKGEAGADRIEGGSGRDHVRGGTGPDRIKGGSGSDRLRGGAGDDVLIDRAGARNRLYGGSGSDRMFANNSKRDWLNGGAGRDRARIDRRLDRTHSVENVSRRRSTRP